MRIFLIADTHFFHEALIELCGRPTNFTDRIVKNWCNCIKEDDLIVHLGDVTLGYDEDSARLVKETLPGRKILVKGNHDKKSKTWYMSHGFDFCCDEFTWKDILLSHKRLDLSGRPKITFNIHGHFHNTQHHKWEP